MTAIMPHTPDLLQLMLDIPGAREDIDRQRAADRTRDRDRGRPSNELILVRVRAYLEALQLADDIAPVRQALIDIASACEEQAASLPRPSLYLKEAA